MPRHVATAAIEVTEGERQAVAVEVRLRESSVGRLRRSLRNARTACAAARERIAELAREQRRERRNSS